MASYTDVPTILANSWCYNQYGPGGFPLMEVQLLVNWLQALNPSANVTPAALMTSANCYNNYSAQSWLLKLGLEKNIAAGLTASGTDVPTLLNSSACYVNYGPGVWPVLYIDMLAKTVSIKSPSTAVDAVTLLTASSCWNNYSAQSEFKRRVAQRSRSMSLLP